MLDYCCMSGELETAMITLEGLRDPLAMVLGESTRRNAFVAASVIKERRGNRSQLEIARAAGISQTFLSELENERKRLTPSTAQKLAPVLETTPDHLLLAERWGRLMRTARKGKIDPRPLLFEAHRLAEVLPSGKIGDVIIDALVGVVRQGMKPLT